MGSWREVAAQTLGKPQVADDGPPPYDSAMADRLSSLPMHDELLLGAVLENMADGVLVADSTGNVILHNRQAQHLVGSQPLEGGLMTRAAEVGLFDPASGERFSHDALPLYRAVQGETFDDVRVLIRNADHPKGLLTSCNGRPIVDSTGTAKGGVIVVRDITETHRTELELENALRELGARTAVLETVYDSIADGVVVADREGNFTLWNPSAERIVGIGMTETGPEEWPDQYGIFYRDGITKCPVEEVPLARAIRGEPCDNVELFLCNPMIPDGLYVSVNGRPLRDDAGGIVGGVVVFRDVTPHVMREEALMQAFDEGRLDVVDTTLHNIGNAINSAETGMQTLTQELEQARLLKRLSALADTMQSHRDDLADWLASDWQGRKAIPFLAGLANDFARANGRLRRVAGRVSGSIAHISGIVQAHRPTGGGRQPRKEIELRKALQDAVKLALDSFDRTNVSVTVTCRKAPRTIWVQETRFQQMIVNLSKNAVEAIEAAERSGKLDSPPAIRIGVRAGNRHLVIDVVDNGIGMTESQRAAVFSPRYTTKQSGSGLGLHSAANYAAGIGGSIEALSEGPGRGATIRIRLRIDALTRESGGVEGA